MTELDILIAQALVLMVCSIGIGFSWGKYTGISRTLDYLQEEGIIDLDD
jgi:hypothetical protein|tara:strand:+ start:148 stop:294 length:147 start_codon:yes stop_codon:yes gene_type:complete